LSASPATFGAAVLDWPLSAALRGEKWPVNSGLTLFSQLIQDLSEKEFQKCVARYNGDSNFRGFSCWEQSLAMALDSLLLVKGKFSLERCRRTFLCHGSRASAAETAGSGSAAIAGRRDRVLPI